VKIYYTLKFTISTDITALYVRAISSQPSHPFCPTFDVILPSYGVVVGARKNVSS